MHQALYCRDICWQRRELRSNWDAVRDSLQSGVLQPCGLRYSMHQAFCYGDSCWKRFRFRLWNLETWIWMLNGTVCTRRYQHRLLVGWKLECSMFIRASYALCIDCVYDRFSRTWSLQHLCCISSNMWYAVGLVKSGDASDLSMVKPLYATTCRLLPPIMIPT